MHPGQFTAATDLTKNNLPCNEVVESVLSKETLHSVESPIRDNDSMPQNRTITCVEGKRKVQLKMQNLIGYLFTGTLSYMLYQLLQSGEKYVSPLNKRPGTKWKKWRKKCPTVGTNHFYWER